MSYDLLVFDPKAAPREPADFLSWLENLPKVNAKEARRPETAAQELQKWYRDIIRGFPALNGPDAEGMVATASKSGDYTFSKSVVFAAFAWSAAEDAYKSALALAQEHQIGFWDTYSEEVFGPKAEGVWGIWFTTSTVAQS